MTRVVLVPGTLALLPEYAGLEDPVAELRAACVEAVSWLDGSVRVVADQQGERVAEALLSAAGVSRLGRQGALAPQPPDGGSRLGRQGALAPQPPDGGSRLGRQGALAPQPTDAYLVVGNGSACRTEKAPGHLDERAVAFDDALGAALVGCDREALAGLDQGLARELWASTAAFPQLADVLADGATASVDYEGDPHGVQYWVIRWEIPG